LEAPRFLEVEEVLEIHLDQIDRYGGASGVRDSNLLESAVQTPRMTFGGQFLYADLHRMAAALLFSLVNNHPFIDGNKRSGTAAALVFLSLNGIQIREDEPALSDLVISVASGTASVDDVAEYLRSHTET
jgi:death on curing protein